MEQERGTTHADLDDSSNESENSFIFNCPYLGTMEDVHTALSFPAIANHCFRTKNPATVDMSHQVAYCLTEKHTDCHVFQLTAEPLLANNKNNKTNNLSRRNRRASIYALPLILILIFLAAIIWWPAPGTSLDDAIAFGAQLRGDIRDGFAAAEGAVAEVNLNPLEDAAPISNTAETQLPGVNEATDAGGKANTAADELPAPALVVQESVEASSEVTTIDIGSDVDATSAEPENVENAIEPGEEQIVVTEAETIEKETTVDDQEETAVLEPAAQESEESSHAIDPPAVDRVTVITVEEDPLEAQESNLERMAGDIENVVEGEETTSATASDPEEIGETPALVISDLPIISNQLPAQNAAPDQPAAVSTEGERIVLIGPETSETLALRQTSSNARALFVRQSPSIESELLTIVNSRRQAAVLGRDSSSAWFKVRLDSGIEGWIDAAESRTGIDPSSLQLVGQQAAAAVDASVAISTAYPVIRSAVVSAGALNLRSGPGVEYEPITIVNKGELVGLLGRLSPGVWVRVRLNSGIEGWVNASLLAPLK
ncbi:MAG: SH3 domain-containing protein [Candidatus Promineifilaceae bacterium]|nr:SH3 domain-containing protein [Candidatus Promineifilaceae bacterium]